MAETGAGFRGAPSARTRAVACFVTATTPPESAVVAIIEYEGVEHRVSVRHGHFLFVAWDTPYARDPVLVGFE